MTPQELQRQIDEQSLLVTRTCDEPTIEEAPPDEEQRWAMYRATGDPGYMLDFA